MPAEPQPAWSGAQRRLNWWTASLVLLAFVIVNGALQSTLIPSAQNPELKWLLQTGLQIFQGHQQHAEQPAR